MMAQYSSSYWSIVTMETSDWSIGGHLSEADPVGLAAEVLALGKVEALNVAKNPGMILETVCWGSDIGI